MNGNIDDRITTYISTVKISLAGNEEIHRVESKSGQSFKDHASHCNSRIGATTDYRDVASVYKKACEESDGTFFQLVSNRPNEMLDQEVGSAFKRGKAYFEGLSYEGTRSKHVTSAKGRTEISFSSFESQQRTPGRSSFQVENSGADIISSTCQTEKDSSSFENTMAVKSDEANANEHDDFYLPTTSNQTFSDSLTSSSSILQDTTITTATHTASSESRDNVHKSSTDNYGATDWYMDILLRMQALDMKQQSLIVQFDFLEKLANDNRQDFTKARDWAQYETEMTKIGVY